MVAGRLAASNVVVKSKLVSDALWAKVKERLAPEPPTPKGGRPRVDDRAAHTGIVFVLRTRIQCNRCVKWRDCESALEVRVPRACEQPIRTSKQRYVLAGARRDGNGRGRPLRRSHSGSSWLIGGTSRRSASDTSNRATREANAASAWVRARSYTPWIAVA